MEPDKKKIEQIKKKVKCKWCTSRDIKLFTVYDLEADLHKPTIFMILLMCIRCGRVTFIDNL